MKCETFFVFVQFGDVQNSSGTSNLILFRVSIKGQKVYETDQKMSETVRELVGDQRVNAKMVCSFSLKSQRCVKLCINEKNF